MPEDQRDIIDALQSLADGQGEGAAEEGGPLPEPMIQTYDEPVEAFVPAVRRASSLDRQLTWIPILLTCGTLLMVFATLPLVVNPDSPLALLPAWCSVAGYIGGILLLLVAGANMGNVQHLLKRRGR